MGNLPTEARPRTLRHLRGRRYAYLGRGPRRTGRRRSAALRCLLRLVAASGNRRLMFALYFAAVVAFILGVIAQAMSSDTKQAQPWSQAALALGLYVLAAFFLLAALRWPV